MSNLISLFGAIKADGKLLITNPASTFLRDVTPELIVWVRSPTLVKDLQGNERLAFQIVYVNPQNLTFETFYLPTEPNLLTLANFLTGLGVVSATNKFTLYQDLVKSSDQAQNSVAADTDYLINDIYATRQYLPGQDQTAVTVNLKNRLSTTQFFFEGDQTNAGHYQYFTSGGNS